MRYLMSQDYNTIIQLNQMRQMVNGFPSPTASMMRKLYQVEDMGIEEIKSYLTQRWDVSAEFTNTGIWNPNTSYTATDRVYIDGNGFTSSIDYATSSVVINNGIGYCSNQYISATTSFDTSKWDNIGNQYDLYYAKFPVPQFDINQYYNLNDAVFWKGHTYSASSTTKTIGQQDRLQYNQTTQIPNKNVLPNDRYNNFNQEYWVDQGTYSIPLSILPTNTLYWIQGDNRSSQMVLCLMEMVLYNLGKSIAPENVPDFRVKAYDHSISWLKAAANGKLTINFPILQPVQGLKIRWTSEPKNDNRW